MQGLKVLQAGPLALVQDGGRRGVMHTGLTQSGPLDRHAFAWANRLLGNPWRSPAVEITLGGLKLEAQVDTWVAVTGADLQLRLNGQPQPIWQSFMVKAGDVLQFAQPRQGLRAYLAVAGGLQLAPGLGGSCASVSREGLGGSRNDGQKLQSGEVLPCLSVREGQMRRVPAQYVPDYQAEHALPVVLAAQWQHFSSAALQTFFNSDYLLSPRSDRMGARLQGPAVEVKLPGMVSEGIALGSIQIPADGQPIILLQDRQTIGGYPKLGVLTAAGISALAQRMPGAKLRFTPLSLFAAQQQERQFLSFFAS
ncbi:5-oxoprolinase subunit C family protein [Balneatrix alpica]|uniref:Biotin-dependent carboxyltransferase family protein n=1 Tax=Balneatrix alpica TaxID=75684 RepID=A0ABV5ZF90_9GAMM|nr:biotin-dependent carboxyltransferase family protein [Balneatrix alpica]